MMAGFNWLSLGSAVGLVPSGGSKLRHEF